ncbi:MAG TPA: hypothetical protein VH478_16400 [Trebonia sp.]|nr:hypothetical protein [Trebonia sp.]
MADAQDLHQIEYRHHQTRDLSPAASSMTSRESLSAWDSRIRSWVRHPHSDELSESACYQVFPNGQAALAWRFWDERAASRDDGSRGRPLVSRVVVGSAGVLSPEVALAACRAGLSAAWAGPLPGEVPDDGELPMASGAVLTTMAREAAADLDRAAAGQDGLQAVVAAALAEPSAPLAISVADRVMQVPLAGCVQCVLLWGLRRIAWPLLGEAGRGWSFSTYELSLGETDPASLPAIVFRVARDKVQAPPSRWRQEVKVRPFAADALGEGTPYAGLVELATQLTAEYRRHGGAELQRLIARSAGNGGTAALRVERVAQALRKARPPAARRQASPQGAETLAPAPPGLPATASGASRPGTQAPARGPAHDTAAVPGPAGAQAQSPGAGEQVPAGGWQPQEPAVAADGSPPPARRPRSGSVRPAREASPVPAPPSAEPPTMALPTAGLPTAGLPTAGRPAAAPLSAAQPAALSSMEPSSSAAAPSHASPPSYPRPPSHEPPPSYAPPPSHEPPPANAQPAAPRQPAPPEQPSIPPHPPGVRGRAHPSQSPASKVAELTGDELAGAAGHAGEGRAPAPGRGRPDQRPGELASSRSGQPVPPLPPRGQSVHRPEGWPATPERHVPLPAGPGPGVGPASSLLKELEMLTENQGQFQALLDAFRHGEPITPEERGKCWSVISASGWYENIGRNNNMFRSDDLSVIFELVVLPDLAEQPAPVAIARWAREAPVPMIQGLLAAAMKAGAETWNAAMAILEPALAYRWTIERFIRDHWDENRAVPSLADPPRGEGRATLRERLGRRRQSLAEMGDIG